MNEYVNGLQAAAFNVDTVVLERDLMGLHVLLVQRSGDARTEPGKWALPGGAAEPAEPLARAAVRELKEETGFDVPEARAHWFGTYEWARPEARYVTAAHVLPEGTVFADGVVLPDPRAGDEVQDVQWMRVDRVAQLAREDGSFLAFDHDLILRDALFALSLAVRTAEHGDRDGVCAPVRWAR